jgi:hypothetical protein
MSQPPKFQYADTSKYRSDYGTTQNSLMVPVSYYSRGATGLPPNWPVGVKKDSSSEDDDTDKEEEGQEEAVDDDEESSDDTEDEQPTDVRTQPTNDDTTGSGEESESDEAVGSESESEGHVHAARYRLEQMIILNSTHPSESRAEGSKVHFRVDTHDPAALRAKNESQTKKSFKEQSKLDYEIEERSRKAGMVGGGMLAVRKRRKERRARWGSMEGTTPATEAQVEKTQVTAGSRPAPPLPIRLWRGFGDRTSCRGRACPAHICIPSPQPLRRYDLLPQQSMRQRIHDLLFSSRTKCYS